MSENEMRNHAVSVPFDYGPCALDTDLSSDDKRPRGFRSAAAGDVEVMKPDGTSFVWPSVAAGETIKCVFIQVLSEDTTVDDPETNITILY